MQWPNIQQLIATVEQPSGYSCELLKISDTGVLIAGLREWYPNIEVGNGSCYLRPSFYETRVFFEEEQDADFIVFTFKKDDELVGMVSYERDTDSSVLYGRVGAVARLHRGSRLGQNFPLLGEALGKAMNAGMIYGLATLSIPNVQATFDRLGWTLIGITPGFDKEQTAPGVIQRVYEAVYAKVLVADTDLLHPRAENLTPRVRALFELLYPGRIDESEA